VSGLVLLPLWAVVFGAAVKLQTWGVWSLVALVLLLLVLAGCGGKGGGY